ncbi:MAG: DegT/DnrJ/EryC1/StrS family aminotransferase [Desulfosarcina sp.]|nr:DegT/DnrJ/EryC1/StrS family aminotransferase [Desulfobacterales bacterium]
MTPTEKDRLVFTGEFTRQEPIPEEGIRRALALMRNGRLHRYNTAPGEVSEVALLEKEFADYVQTKYCAGFNSCGSAIYVALKSAGARSGDGDLCNAFTLAPVPGAIENVGGRVVLVEITEDYTIDLNDLERKAVQSGAKFLLLSHMRGHIADMDRVSAVCAQHGIDLIEDCAHTTGCRWGERSIGTFGAVGCFSTQTYKHLNSGEGGLLATDDDDIMAQAILYSGSYMLYEGHISRPPMEVFERFKKRIPNFSLRMTNLQAALIRPQLERLPGQCQRWNQRYALLEEALREVDHIRVPRRHAKEHYVGSSIQFSIQKAALHQMERFIEECGRRGVEIKWFGGREPVGFTSAFDSWEYIQDKPPLPRTKQILDFLCDFRIPLTFSMEDCRFIAAVIRQVADETFTG